MDEYIYFDKVKDAQLIEFLKRNVTKSARKVLGIRLGFLKRGPYSSYKAAYPTIIKFYLEWLSSPTDDRNLDFRKDE